MAAAPAPRLARDAPQGMKHHIRVSFLARRAKKEKQKEEKVPL
jgi:hypothetical protein